MSVASASRTVTFAGALTVATAIKTSVATVAAPASYTTSGLNGAVGTTQMVAARRITATLASHASSYVAASIITITGLDENLDAVSDVLTIAGTGGGVTYTTTKFFRKVNTIAIAAQADTGGAFTFGVSDALVPGRVVQLRVGTAGNINLGYANGTSDCILKVAVGEAIPCQPNIIYGDSTTTVQDITAYVE